MALDYPVLYYRTNATRKALTAYDTVEKLVNAKSTQVLKFDTSDIQIESIAENGQNNIIDEPVFSPTGKRTINKQEVGKLGKTLVINGNLKRSFKAQRHKMRGFAQLQTIEVEYHKYGSVGIYFPDDLSDFSVDPTDHIGYTMDDPTFNFSSPSEVIAFSIILSLGVNNLT